MTVKAILLRYACLSGIYGAFYIKAADRPSVESVVLCHPATSYTLHRPCDCTVPGCVTESSPDTDTQSSTLVLCPPYLGLSASAPQCLGLDTCGTPWSSVPQSLSVQVLPNIGGFMPRSLKDYTPRHFDASRLFRACAVAPLVPRCPRALVPLCLEDMPRCFDALEAFKPCASVPSVASVPLLSIALVPRCFNTFGTFRT
ncbi:UNVERIFIED_CONTAM: hypothetical protein FKN15_064843 [Acipenser sinensis]